MVERFMSVERECEALNEYMGQLLPVAGIDECVRQAVLMAPPPGEAELKLDADIGRGQEFVGSLSPESRSDFRERERERE